MALSFVDSLQRGSESPELVVVRCLFRLVRGKGWNNETMRRAYRKRYGVGKGGAIYSLLAEQGSAGILPARVQCTLQT